MAEGSFWSDGAPSQGALRMATKLALGIVVVVLGLAMVAAVDHLPEKPVGLGASFQDAQLRGERLQWAEVKNPVTAVLLNFRGYDTLLEVAVLVVALWAAQALGLLGEPPVVHAGQGLLTRSVVSVFVPVAMLVAGELLWLGSDFPGGAFQAGTVLGCALVLLRLTGVYRGLREGKPHQRLLVAAGFLLFCIMGILCLPLTGTFLDYPTGWAKPFIVVIEAAVMISVAIIVQSLFDRTAAVGLSRGHHPLGAHGSAEGQAS